MNILDVVVRRAAAASLIATAALSLLWIMLDPPFPGTGPERLEALESAGGVATLATTAFTLSQLFFLGAVVGIAQLAGAKAPLLSILGGALGVIGGFGHTVVGGAHLMHLAMAADAGNRAVYGALLDGELPLPFEILSLAGLVGTVLGLLLLAIALLRARVGARWVPYVLFAFLLAEFVGSAFSEWISLAAALLYLAAFTALAVTVWRSARGLRTHAGAGDAPARASSTR